MGSVAVMAGDGAGDEGSTSRSSWVNS
jgi:hypothetical protein